MDNQMNQRYGTYNPEYATYKAEPETEPGRNVVSLKDLISDQKYEIHGDSVDRCKSNTVLW
jgi:hypothetical protein